MYVHTHMPVYSLYMSEMNDSNNRGYSREGLEIPGTHTTCEGCSVIGNRLQVFVRHIANSRATTRIVKNEVLLIC